MSHTIEAGRRAVVKHSSTLSSRRNDHGDAVADLRPGAEVTAVLPLDGPDGNTWWYVRAEGWAADHRMVGDVQPDGLAFVEYSSADPGLFLRTDAGDRGDIMAEMAPDTKLDILSHAHKTARAKGRTYTWWNVQIEGWVPEDHLTAR